MTKTNFAAGAVATVLMLLAAPSFAHHSFAMFDTSQATTLDVVVQQWAFNNPHVWLYGIAKTSDGTTTKWSFEGPGVTALLGRGITGDTFKPGSKVRVVFCPLRDGRHGGHLALVRTDDGKIYTPNDGGCPAPVILGIWQKQGWLDSDQDGTSHPVATPGT